MTSLQAWIALLAFTLLWWSTAWGTPRPVSAIEPAALAPVIHAALEHLELPLPSASGTHAVEFWNGVVCRGQDATPNDYTCAAPADPSE